MMKMTPTLTQRRVHSSSSKEEQIL